MQQSVITCVLPWLSADSGPWGREAWRCQCYWSTLSVCGGWEPGQAPFVWFQNGTDRERVRAKCTDQHPGRESPTWDFFFVSSVQHLWRPSPVATVPQMKANGLCPWICSKPEVAFQGTSYATMLKIPPSCVCPISIMVPSFPSVLMLLCQRLNSSLCSPIPF